MKKLFLIIGIVSLFSNLNFAQSKHKIGVVFGPNYFSLRGKIVEDDAISKYGYFIGVSYEYKFNKRLSLVASLILDEKKTGFNSQFSDRYFDQFGVYVTENYTVNTINKYHYLTLPILLRYHFGKNKSFYTNVGFFLATTTNTESNTILTNQTTGLSYNVITRNSYNFTFADYVFSTDYGASFGIGKSFKVSNKTQLSIEIRDNLGIDNQIGGLNANGLSGNIKTNTLSLIAQLSFDL